MARIIQYLKLPEARLFWIYFVLFILYLAVSAIFVQGPFNLIAIAVLAGLGVVILISSLRLARMNLEVKLERNELSSIISNLNDGVIAYDPGFRVVIFNRAAEEIFGVLAEDVVGQIFSPERARDAKFALLSQIIFPSLAPLVIKKTEAGVYPQISDFVFENPKIYLRATTGKIADPNGQLLGFVKIIKDKTREVEILKSKNTFIEVAAHELRTPLTGANWAFDALGKEDLTDQQKKIVADGLMAARRALQSVNDLLDVAKIEEGKFDYRFEKTDIVSFVENILSEMMPIAQKAGIKIYFQKPGGPIDAFVDFQKFSIALSNIVSNAIKYNVENGEVFVEIKKLEDSPYSQISIRDTGIGVPPEQIKNIFTKFFRADNAKKLVTEGIGLGLNISRNIIKRHGGEIRAESALNRGTTFYISLPSEQALVPEREIVAGDDEELL